MKKYTLTKKKSGTKKTKKSQKGSGFFTTEIKKYSNLKYKDSSFVLPNLLCPIKGCNGKEFKHRYLKISTRAKAFLLDTNFFDNKYNSFTCIKCGFVQLYSGKIKYESQNLSK